VGSLYGRGGIPRGSRIRRPGKTHLILLAEAGSAERTLANIARLGAEVLPVVRARLTASKAERPMPANPS
jgi:hypothetical protein